MNLNQIDAYRAEATVTLTEDEIFWIWLSMRPYIEEVHDSERPQLAEKLTAIRKELSNVHDDLQRACNEHDIKVYAAARAARQARAKADLEAAIQGY